MASIDGHGKWSSLLLWARARRWRRAAGGTVVMGGLFAVASSIDAALRARELIYPYSDFRFANLGLPWGLLVPAALFGVPLGLVFPGHSIVMDRRPADVREVVLLQVWRRGYVVATVGGAVVGGATLCSASAMVPDGEVSWTVYGAAGGLFWGALAGQVIGGFGGLAVAAGVAAAMRHTTRRWLVYAVTATAAASVAMAGVAVVVFPMFRSQEAGSGTMPGEVFGICAAATVVLAVASAPLLISWAVPRPVRQGPTVS